MTEFTHEEIETLLEAVDCWEKDISRGNLTGMLMGAILCPPDQKDKFEVEQRRKMESGMAKERARRDAGVLLKAKIIGIRRQLDSMTADKIIEQAQG